MDTILSTLGVIILSGALIWGQFVHEGENDKVHRQYAPERVKHRYVRGYYRNA